MNEQNYDLSPEEDEKLMHIYEWVDSSPLSRPKKNIARDFCDGVLVAEMIKNVYPTIVELHNYPSSNATKQKQQNWATLNRKVLKRIGISLSQKEIDDVVSCKQFAIEQVLAKIYNKIYSQDEGNDTIKYVLSIFLKTLFNRFSDDIGKKNTTEGKTISKDEMIKAAIQEKDNKISVLNSTLEVLQLKLKNSEEENKRLEEKIQLYQLKLMNKK